MIPEKEMFLGPGTVALDCNPSYLGREGRKIMVQGYLQQKNKL
jgi:hypothetical protein